jgi:hypothetical protein
MTLAAPREFDLAPSKDWTWPVIWFIALAGVGLLYLYPQIAPWAVKYPVSEQWPVAKWTGDAMAWLVHRSAQRSADLGV